LYNATGANKHSIGISFREAIVISYGRAFSLAIVHAFREAVAISFGRAIK
jgi:hypothetical protein